MNQDRLFRLAVGSYSLNAHHIAGEGWTVVIRCRRLDESWEETTPVCYSRLTTVELLDTMAAHAEAVL